MGQVLMIPKLRLLFLAGRDVRHPHAGGGDVQAWAWAAWAARSGHHVTYVCMSGHGLPPLETVDGVVVHRLGTGPGLALRAFSFYRQRRDSFDLLYEDPIGGGRTPYFSPLWSSAPVVAVWHQVTAQLLFAMHPWPLAATLAASERIMARAYWRCHLWVPSAERAEEVASSLGFQRNHVHVISPTLPSQVGHPSNAPSRRGPTVLFLGVMRRYKAIDHLVEAFAKIAGKVQGARLVVAGRRLDDDYERELRQLVAERGIGHSVVFMQSVSEATKERLLDEARVLVLPSLLEGFGIVTIEANARGTPVIASSGVPSAAVVDGETGLRYRFGEIDELANALLQLLTDNALWQKLSAASASHARNFEEAKVAVRFEAMLVQALSPSDRAA